MLALRELGVEDGALIGRETQPLRGLRSGAGGRRLIRAEGPRLPLIAVSLILWMPLLGCSHSSSNVYSAVGQPSSAPPPGATPVAATPPGYYASTPAIAAALPPPSYPPAAAAAPPPSGYPNAAAPVSPPSPPPNEYDQAAVSAYPSVSLADIVRGHSASSPPPPTAAGPPIALQAAPNVPANGVPAPYSAVPPYSPPAPPGSAIPGPGVAPSYGAAGAGTVPAAAAAPPQPDYDQAVTAAYPSESLGDLIRGASH